jgi:hypothetical protein
MKHLVNAVGLKRLGSVKEGQPSGRRYSTYEKSGYNARTCQEAIDTSGLSDSE